MKLIDLQKLFRDSIRDPKGEKQKLSSAIKSPAERISIYKNNSNAVLTNTLSEIYPVCERLLGTELFKDLCLEFIANHDARSYDLNDYGQEFARFVETEESLSDLEYLGDVARLEWAWHKAFYAKNDEDILSINELVERNAEIKFRLPHSASLLESKYPIFKIWNSNLDDFEGDDLINLNQESGDHLIIFRRNLDLCVHQVEAEYWPLLEAIYRSEDIETAAEKLYDDQAKLSEHLMDLLQRGWLIAYEQK